MSVNSFGNMRLIMYCPLSILFKLRFSNNDYPSVLSVYENFYKARLDNWFKRYAINLMVNNELNKDA